jgi:hypothetical protein
VSNRRSHIHLIAQSTIFFAGYRIFCKESSHSCHILKRRFIERPVRDIFVMFQISRWNSWESDGCLDRLRSCDITLLFHEEIGGLIEIELNIEIDCS